jgi:hypothetical protein
MATGFCCWPKRPRNTASYTTYEKTLTRSERVYSICSLQDRYETHGMVSPSRSKVTGTIWGRPSARTVANFPVLVPLNMKPFAYLVRVLRGSKGEKVEEITSLSLLSKKRRDDVDIPILDKD